MWHNIPQHHIKDIVASLYALSSSILVRLNCRLLRSVEYASIHSLIDAGRFLSYHLSRWSQPLRRFPIDTPRDIFATDCKIARGDIGIMLAMELLR